MTPYELKELWGSKRYCAAETKLFDATIKHWKKGIPSETLEKWKLYDYDIFELYEAQLNNDEQVLIDAGMIIDDMCIVRITS